MVVFFISGIWHGANWTFIIWGGIHGIMQILEKQLGTKLTKRSSKNIQIIKILIVFSMVSIAWIFFASNSLDDSFYIIKNMIVGIKHPRAYLLSGIRNLGLNFYKGFYIAFSSIILTIYDYFLLKRDVIEYISYRKASFRWILYIIFILWMIINIPYNNTSTEFIYFQF